MSQDQSGRNQAETKNPSMLYAPEAPQLLSSTAPLHPTFRQRCCYLLTISNSPIFVVLLQPSRPHTLHVKILARRPVRQQGGGGCSIELLRFIRPYELLKSSIRASGFGQCIGAETQSRLSWFVAHWSLCPMRLLRSQTTSWSLPRANSTYLYVVSLFLM